MCIELTFGSSSRPLLVRLCVTLSCSQHFFFLGMVWRLEVGSVNTSALYLFPIIHHPHSVATACMCAWPQCLDAASGKQLWWLNGTATIINALLRHAPGVGNSHTHNHSDSAHPFQSSIFHFTRISLFPVEYRPHMFTASQGEPLPKNHCLNAYIVSTPWCGLSLPCHRPICFTNANFHFRSGDGTRLYLAYYNASVSVVDTATGDVVAHWSLTAVMSAPSADYSGISHSYTHVGRRWPVR